MNSAPIFQWHHLQLPGHRLRRDLLVSSSRYKITLANSARSLRSVVEVAVGHVISRCSLVGPNADYAL